MKLILKKGWNGEYRPLDLFLALIFTGMVYSIILFLSISLIHSKTLLGLTLLLIYSTCSILGIWFTVALWRGSRESKVWWKWLVRGFLIYSLCEYIGKWIS